MDALSDGILRAERLAGAIDVGARTHPGPAARWADRLGTLVVDPGERAPRWRLYGLAVVGIVLTAIVAALTADNPHASPAHIAVVLRVVIIVSLIGAGIYAQTSQAQVRMGKLLVAAGLYSVVWLLNGSRDRVLFTVGAYAAAFAQWMFVFLWLAHPTGRIRSMRERRLLAVGSVAGALWVLFMVLTGQPPLKTGLLQCVPRCPSAPWSLRVDPTSLTVLKTVIALAWIGLVASGAVLVIQRARTATAPTRAALAPVALVAAVNTLLLVLYLVLLAADARGKGAIGAAFVECAAAIPIAVLIGLACERMFMGQALAKFVTELAARPDEDPQVLMAEAIQDPSLKIAYRLPWGEELVDASGAEIERIPDDQVMTWIRRSGDPVAGVMFSRELADQSGFVAAAGAAALMRIEQAQIEADFKASTARLNASRARLVERAQAERRSLERDLHDSVQQQLVALRIKLDRAAETIDDDPAQASRTLTDAGRRMDDLLQELRALARGVYPVILQSRGLASALRSAADNAPVPATIRASGIDRYAQPTEVAVYFCCLEALQNVTKHAGPDAWPVVTLWETPGRLCFEVRDSGVGFDVERVAAGSGLINMRDRVEILGGALTVASTPGWRTSVRGWVPVP